jgi:hypothetical protein
MEQKQKKLNEVLYLKNFKENEGILEVLSRNSRI